jgi:hypothetical protein
MRGQATIEFMMIFLVTMAAIAMIFYPLAKAHRDFGAEAEVVKDKQNFEDFIFGAQIYCNGNFRTPSGILGTPGQGFKIRQNRVYLVLEGGREERFEGFFKGCTSGDVYEPV